MAAIDLRSAVEDISTESGVAHDTFYEHLAEVICRSLNLPSHARSDPHLQILEAYTRSFFPFSRLSLALRLQLCRGLELKKLDDGEFISKDSVPGLWMVFSGTVHVSRSSKMQQLVAGDAFRVSKDDDSRWLCRAHGTATLLHLTQAQIDSVIAKEHQPVAAGLKSFGNGQVLKILNDASATSYTTLEEQMQAAQSVQILKVAAGETIQAPDCLVVLLSGEVGIYLLREESPRETAPTTKKPSRPTPRKPSNTSGKRSASTSYTRHAGRSLAPAYSYISSPSYSAGFAVSTRYNMSETIRSTTRCQSLVGIAVLSAESVLDTTQGGFIFQATKPSTVAKVSKQDLGLFCSKREETVFEVSADARKAFFGCSYSKFVPLHVMDSIAEACKLVTFPAHTIISSQGVVCPYVFIVVKGVVSLHQRRSTGASSSCLTTIQRFGPCLRRVSTGGSIGEQEALRAAASAYTCIAAGEVVLLALEAVTFRNVFSPSFVKCNLELPPRTPTGVGRAAHAAKWLKAIFRESKSLRDMQEDTLVHLCQEAQWLDFAPNDTIWPHPSRFDAFILVLEGSVSIFLHETSTSDSTSTNSTSAESHSTGRLRNCVTGIMHRQRLIHTFKPLNPTPSAPHAARAHATLGVCVGVAFQGCGFGKIDEEIKGRQLDDGVTVVSREHSRCLVMPRVLVHKLHSAMQTRVTAELARVLRSTAAARTEVDRAALGCFLRETRLLAEVKRRFLGAGVKELERLCEQVQLVEVARGETIFRKGQPCTACYMVLAGEVEVDAEVLHAGECLGHEQVMCKENQVRNQTAIARTEASLLGLSRRALEEAKLHEASAQEIRGLIQQSCVMRAHPAARKALLQLCSSLVVERFHRDVDVVKKGDEVQFIYFFLDGSFRISCDAVDVMVDAKTNVNTFPYLGVGEETVCLGTSFKYGLKAFGGTTFLKLSVEDYSTDWPADLRTNGVLQLLQQNCLFRNATKSELTQMALLAQATSRPKNAEIFKAGEKLTMLALVKHGECSVSHHSGSSLRTSRILAKGDTFGEEYFEQAANLRETLTATTTNVQLLLFRFKHLHAIFLPPLRQSFISFSRTKREWAEALKQRQANCNQAVDTLSVSRVEIAGKARTPARASSWLAAAIRVASSKDRNRGNRFMGKTFADCFTAPGLPS